VATLRAKATIPEHGNGDDTDGDRRARKHC
jgi:hypothetical protein